MKDITYPHFEPYDDATSYYLSGTGRANEEERNKYEGEIVRDLRRA